MNETPPICLELTLHSDFVEWKYSKVFNAQFNAILGARLVSKFVIKHVITFSFYYLVRGH